MDDMHKYLQGEQLEGALFAWIKGGSLDLIEQGLQSEYIAFTDFEELVRYAVQCKNTPAFEVLIAHAHENFTAVKYNMIVRSVVWDSVTHCVADIFQRFFDWRPESTSMAQWRHGLYMHAVKSGNLSAVEHLQKHVSLDRNSWGEALVGSIGQGNAAVFEHLLKHRVALSPQKALTESAHWVCYTSNPKELWAVAFAYASLADLLNATPLAKHADIEEHYSAHQAQVIAQHLDISTHSTKRKI